MKRHLTAALAVFFGCVALAPRPAAGQAAPPQEPPRFRSGVDVVPIDVTVVDDQGRPVPISWRRTFKVFINGVSRRVVTADWTSFGEGPPRPNALAAEGYSSNEQATNGRLIVLAIDQGNIRFGGGRVIKEAIDRFLDNLSGSDRVALVGLGRGTQSIPFTADRDRIKQAVSRMNGQLRPPATTPMLDFSLSLEAAVALTRGNTVMVESSLQGTARRLASQCGPAACEQEIMRLAYEAVKQRNPAARRYDPRAEGRSYNAQGDRRSEIARAGVRRTRDLRWRRRRTSAAALARIAGGVRPHEHLRAPTGRSADLRQSARLAVRCRQVPTYGSASRGSKP